MLRLKQENVFRWLDIKSFKNSKFRLTASLPDHICKPRHQIKHCTATILCHSTKLTSEMCLFGFWQVHVGPLCLVVSFIFHQAVLLHAAKLYRCINFSNQHFSQAVYLDATTSILQRLHYSRSIGQVQIWYSECKIRVKSVWKWAWQDRYIHSLLDDSPFALHSFQWTK